MIEKKGKKTGAGRTRPLILFVVTAITLIVLASPLSAADGGRMLIPGGVPFGVRLCHEGVTVVGLPDVRTGGTGSGSPAKDAGIRVRDIILSVDGKRVTSAADMAALEDDSATVAIPKGVLKDAVIHDHSGRPMLKGTEEQGDEDGKTSAGGEGADAAPHDRPQEDSPSTDVSSNPRKGWR